MELTLVDGISVLQTRGDWVGELNPPSPLFCSYSKKTCGCPCEKTLKHVFHSLPEHYFETQFPICLDFCLLWKNLHMYPSWIIIFHKFSVGYQKRRKLPSTPPPLGFSRYQNNTELRSINEVNKRKFIAPNECILSILDRDACPTEIRRTAYTEAPKWNTLS